MGGCIKNKRPIQSESPDIFCVVEVVCLVAAGRKRIVEGWERRDFVIYRDTIGRHLAGVCEDHWFKVAG